MKFDPELTAQANFNWGKIVANSLDKLGINDVFFSPGSRSTPLIIGFERNKNINCYPVLDERSAAFIALGFTKRTGTPSVLVCTSGSALTHWFPAVVEASYSGIPLFLLSADRPPELQECGAGQTINQFNLFGSFVRSFHQISPPETSLNAIKDLCSNIESAYFKSMGQNPGPVHLNFPFREPFIPQICEDILINQKFNFNKITKNPPVETIEKKIDDIEQEISGFKRPIIIAGEFVPAEEIISWLEKHPIPIICDSLSPLRNTNFHNRILRYENLLRDLSFAKSFLPDLFIILGPLPTSKTLRQWIDSSNSKRIVIEHRGLNVDPLSSPSKRFQLQHKCLKYIKFKDIEFDWLKNWISHQEMVENKLELEFAKELPCFEAKLSYLLSLHLPNECQLHTANSMPIRDLEWFWQAGDKKIFLSGNRGVNGIDGTLGTAIGIAHKAKKATFLLTGELAFLHDSNSLLFSKEFEGSLNIFLINNQGGGIFENLAVSNQPEFEKCFATPQNCNFEYLCKANNVEFSKPKTWEETIPLIEKPIEQGIRLIEFNTDRKSDKKVRKKFLSIGPYS